MSKRKLKEYRYDEIYGGKGYERKSGFLEWLSSNLKSYDQTRYQTVFKSLEKGQRLLDIGCGNGYFCLMAKQLFDDVYGVDVSKVRIMDAEKAIFNRQDHENFHFVQYDTDERLPFSDDFFDAISCIATLEFLLYPKQAVMEMRRVLRPNGIVVVQVGNIAFLPDRLALLTGRLPTLAGIDEIGVDWDRLHSFTKEVLVKLFRNGGFEIINLSCSGIFANQRRAWLSLLAGDIIVKARKT